MGGFILLVVIGALILFFRTNPTDKQTQTETLVSMNSETDGTTDRKMPAPTFGEKVAPTAPGPRTVSEPHLPTHSISDGEGAEGEPSMREDPFGTRNVPPVELPEGEDTAALESIKLPPRPYSIYVGAYKDLAESETTEREILSNYLPAFIVPIDVQGSVAQSLFGVSQDGIWYRILVGHFPAKEDARNTLARMMKERPEGQPEIMRFDYAVECGRFLDDKQAGELTAELIQNSFFPYEQTYPTTDGRVLIRILVGSNFSEQGTRAQKSALEEKGFSCKTVQR